MNFYKNNDFKNMLAHLKSTLILFFVKRYKIFQYTIIYNPNIQDFSIIIVRQIIMSIIRDQ